MADVNPLETETGNSICSMWNSADKRSPHSHYFGGATLSECLLDLNDLSSLDCNLLSSPWDGLTYFGLEEFNTKSALAADANEFEYMGSDQSLMQSINNFMVSIIK